MITKENIDKVLKNHYYEEVKEFFKSNSSLEKRAEYLKELYGMGGWNTPERGNFIDWVEYSSSGIEFIKRNANHKIEKIKMNWNKIAERLQEIIESESQLSLF